LIAAGQADDSVLPCPPVKVSDTVTNHYVAGRVNVNQYNTLGVRYGYNTIIPLYHCPSLNGWTDHSNCTPI
jgi:hypothetical protein